MKKRDENSIHILPHDFMHLESFSVEIQIFYLTIRILFTCHFFLLTDHRVFIIDIIN